MLLVITTLFCLVNSVCRGSFERQLFSYGSRKSIFDAVDRPFELNDLAEASLLAKAFPLDVRQSTLNLSFSLKVGLVRF